MLKNQASQDISSNMAVGDWDMGGYVNEVIPETVCQWAGLFDKNKTKLYDGDKFKYRKHDGYFLDDFGVVK